MAAGWPQNVSKTIRPLGHLANISQNSDDIKHEAGKSSSGTGTTNAGHRLGPKANQGAINAGLRALDRSGKPCRKWERKPFQLKSFTGVVWELPSWRAPKKPLVHEEALDRATSQPNGSKDSKANDSSVALGSEKSNNTGEQLTETAGEAPVSSPVAAPISDSAAVSAPLAVVASGIIRLP